MKRFFILAIALVFLTGCATLSGLDTSTPEYKAAWDAEARVHALATSVRGADRSSQFDKVLAGERFFANCETYARTTADLLVAEYGAAPAEVYLTTVEIPLRGWFVWNHTPDGWKRQKHGDLHMVVEWGDLVIDNWHPGVTSRDELEWEYKWHERRPFK